MTITLTRTIRAYSVIADAPHSPVHYVTLSAGTRGDVAHIAGGYALLHFRVDGKLYTSNQHVSAIEVLDEDAA